MTDDRDFASYVSARWTQLVRCLFAIGAPLESAHAAAADGLSHCHDEWASRDEWVDLDVYVFRDLLDRWDGRRDAWWERPVPDSDIEALTEAGWPGVEAELDRMNVPDRRALVLREQAGLDPEQVRDVTGVAGGASAAQPALDLFGVLELVPVDPPPIEAMIAASERRRRRRRGLSVAGGLVLVAVAGVVTVLVLRQPDPPGAERDEAFPPVQSVPFDNPSPVAWYGGGKLYLPHSEVEIRDVREFGQWDDGAVYLDVLGNLVTVTGDGERERIATLGADSTFAVSDAADRVVWVDGDGPEVVVHDLVTGVRDVASRPLEEPVRILSAEGDRAHLTSGGELFAVDLTDVSLEPVADDRLPGELDRHGRFVLTREGHGATTARVRLYDTATGRPVPIDITDPGDVVGARFGPDGSVILLIEPPDDAISVVRSCAPPYDDCRLLAWFPGRGTRSLLAQ